MSMPHVSENMLETFMSGVLGTSMQVTASIFALFIVGLGIPLLSVLCRLNLTGSGISQATGDWLSVYFPFGISWLLYRGDLVTMLLSWGGSIFTSLIAFIFPLLLAMRALETSSSDEEGSIEVYGTWWKTSNSTKNQEKRVLQALLVVSILSIAAAIIGNILKSWAEPEKRSIQRERNEIIILGSTRIPPPTESRPERNGLAWTLSTDDLPKSGTSCKTNNDNKMGLRSSR
jgi:hypothetical protein